MKIDARSLVPVLELLRLEAASLLIDDGIGKIEHVLGDFDVLDLVEELVLGPEQMGSESNYLRKAR